MLSTNEAANKKKKTKTFTTNWQRPLTAICQSPSDWKQFLFAVHQKRFVPTEIGMSKLLLHLPKPLKNLEFYLGT
jgi:hypothetical protein